MSTVDVYFKGRFPLLNKVARLVGLVWPKLGAELDDLLRFSVELATDDLSGHHVRKLYYLRLHDLVEGVAEAALAGQAREKIVKVLLDLAMLNLANKGGHEAGNGYIRRVSSALRAAEEELYARGAQLVFIGRLGGDEFGVVCVGLEKSVVDDVVRLAQVEVAMVDLEHIDAGSASLADIPLITQQRGSEGEILVPSGPGRGSTRAVVRRLDLIADERASIAKAAARIDLLVRLRAFADSSVYEEVVRFGMKAISDIDEMTIVELADRLKAGEDVWLDTLALALDLRSRAVGDEPFRRAVSLVAEGDFRE